MLLRKGVYPYEYMDDWEKLNETHYLKKKNHSNLSMEDITDADYMDAKEFVKTLKYKI